MLPILSFLLAISFHSILEGFTLSTQESADAFWGVAITLSLHKWVVAFAFGSTMQKKRFRVREFRKYSFFNQSS